MSIQKISDLLGEEKAKYLLEHQCKTIASSLFTYP
jgi:hypothetical protein